MAGKSGDLVYALPVIKALARQHGPVTLVTSAMCYQIVPLLWEQSYIKDVVMDYDHAYSMHNGSVEPWAYFAPGEGINLSPQPAMYRPDAPVPWTLAYAEIAGIGELTANDKMALPSLWNHRQWYWEHTVRVGVNIGGNSTWKPPQTCVLAPESESIKTVPLWVWAKVAGHLKQEFRVIVVGTRPTDDFRGVEGVIDLRGYTTACSVARLLAEATLAITTISLPFQLSRHAGTPTFCLQDQYLERSIPIDTPYRYYTSDRWQDLVNDAIQLAAKPQTTLWSPSDLEAIRAGDVAALAAR